MNLFWLWLAVTSTWVGFLLVTLLSLNHLSSKRSPTDTPPLAPSTEGGHRPHNGAYYWPTDKAMAYLEAERAKLQ